MSEPQTGEVLETALAYLQHLLDWFNGDGLTDEEFENIQNFVRKHKKKDTTDL